MITKHSNAFFYVGLSLIICIILILDYALFSHFLLHRPVIQTEWLVLGFVGAVVGCSLVGCRLVANLGDKRVVFDEEDRDGIVIINDEVVDDALVIQKVHEYKSAKDIDLVNKKRGDSYLDRARNTSYDLCRRNSYADAAIEAYSEIGNESHLFLFGIYQAGTAWRVKGEFDEAVASYNKFVGLLLEKGPEYFTDQEIRGYRSAAEMMIGEVRKEQDKDDEAEYCFINAWKMNSANFMAPLNVFDLAFKQGDLSKAKVWAGILEHYEEYSSFSHIVEAQLSMLETKR
jgi:tetratricopeptide (TPR) repeat protein